MRKDATYFDLPSFGTAVGLLAFDILDFLRACWNAGHIRLDIEDIDGRLSFFALTIMHPSGGRLAESIDDSLYLAIRDIKSAKSRQRCRVIRRRASKS